MVNIKIISKTIEDAIIKCGRIVGGVKSSLNNHIRHTLNSFFDETKDLTHERVVYMNNKGEVLLRKDGEKYSWRVSSEEMTELVYEDGGLDTILNKGGLHITHNHPGPYRESEYDNGDFTCLSEADMNNLKGTLTFNGERYYRDKSITADCSNGTRMTLVRQTDSFNPSVFDKARDNLISNWRKYIQDSKENTKKELWDFTLKWKEENSFENTGEVIYPFLPPSDVLHDVKVNIERKFAEEHFEEYIQPSIQEFDETGFELSFEWIK